jgi:hypothetical protein
MTASKLIELLSSLPQETEIYVWFDGDRVEIDGIDSIDDDYADINTKPI